METIMYKTVQELIKESLPRTLSYGEYRAKVGELVAEGKSTGPKQTEALTNYTLLNDKRMKRFDKTVKVDTKSMAFISAITRKITFLVLTESWCGDAAPTLPVMNKIADSNPNISLKILLRDENLELMSHFLTEGTLSIPKLIIIDEVTGEVLGDWGPRPSTATEMVKEFKESFGTLTPEFKQDLQVWYNKDKGVTTLKDILARLPLK
ncbi:thioredoxin family protein [Ulvibacterium sp.]|uniref:thioredoxin family protein n=1 Tax=Ulvibacterium sp. TaxID=2665914 RepID=UPI00262E7E82|nr:thioredoxin family protein [Ulvibacterium sp.]